MVDYFPVRRPRTVDIAEPPNAVPVPKPAAFPAIPPTAPPTISAVALVANPPGPLDATVRPTAGAAARTADVIGTLKTEVKALRS